MSRNQGQAQHRPAAGISPQPRNTRRNADEEDPEIPPRPVKADKVGEFFDKAPYHMNYSWAFLKQTIRGADYFPSVTRFYPAQNVAVDMFYNESEYKAGATDLKQKALNKAGIKYAFLAPKVAGHDKADTLETQLKDQ